MTIAIRVHIIVRRVYSAKVVWCGAVLLRLLPPLLQGYLGLYLIPINSQLGGGRYDESHTLNTVIQLCTHTHTRAHTFPVYF